MQPPVHLDVNPRVVKVALFSNYYSHLMTLVIYRWFKLLKTHVIPPPLGGHFISVPWRKKHAREVPTQEPLNNV